MRHWCSIVLFILAPILCLVLVEFMQGSELRPWHFCFWLNLIFYMAVLLLFYALTNRTILGIGLPSALFLILGVINHYVMFFRSAALQPWDFFAAGTAMNVLPAMKLKIDLQVVFAIVGLILILLGAILLRKERKNVRFRLIAAITGMIFTVFIAVNLIWNTGVLRIDAWNTVAASRHNGVAINLLQNLKSMINPPPDGYSTARVKAVVGESHDEKERNKPNVIVIMNESFADLSIFGDLKTNEDPMPFVRNLTENTIKGHVQVSVFGGGTCNTEYDFLTGNLGFMLRPGSYPLEQFVTGDSPSLAKSLKAQGYDTIAIHPYYPNGWNRARAYPHLGFDSFLSIDDFENPQIMRKFISDASSYDKIMEQFHRKSHAPMFIFNVTMQNHLGYDIKYDNFTEDISFQKDKDFPQAKQYLSLIKQSDQAVEKLIAYLKAQKEPTVLLFFGDHLPAIEDSYYKMLKNENGLNDAEFERLKHTVPFFIWANFPIQEQKDIHISTNYLSSLLLNTAEISQNAYQKYLLKLMEQIPVITSEAIEKGDPRLKQYHWIQYNQVFDKKNRLDQVFR